MKKFLQFGLALFLVVGSVHAARIQPVSYRFAPETWKGNKNFADPDFSKLTDGKGGTASRAIWDLKAYHYQPLKIDFKLAAPTALNEVQITYMRGKKSYGIKEVKIYAKGQDGKIISLGGKLLKQPYEVPDGQKTWRDEYLKFPLDSSTAVDNVTVEISVTGSYVALQEFTFSAPETK